MGKPKGSEKTGGRAPGTPNKATVEARGAIALFVDGNAHRLQEWLNKIADDTVLPDGKIIPGNPIKAFELFQSVIEYHVPKLQRQELSGLNGGAIEYKETVSDKEVIERFLKQQQTGQTK